MKAFILQKDTDDDFWSARKKHEKTNLTIESPKQFNCIVLSNPQNSKCICMIDSLRLEVNGKNKICFSLQDSDCEGKVDEKGCTLNMACESAIDDNYDYGNYMFDIKNGENLLKNRVVILIPGGIIWMKLEKSISDMFIFAEWYEEDIYEN